MALYSHHGNCLFILAHKEVYGEERIHNAMETTERKAKIREKGKNHGRTPQANG